MPERPLQPRPIVIPGDREHQLLRRVLRVESDTRCIARIVLVDDASRYVALVDSGSGREAVTSSRNTALHVIWARDEANAAVEVAEYGRLPVAPGDTLTVAAGLAWTYGPGLIVCEVAGARSAGTGRIAGPTHGMETFDGYNRRTLCALAPGLSLERWKVTQPLTLPGDAVLVNLVEPMALGWPGGTDLLGRGEARIVPSGIEQVTLLPDGLGYALVLRTNPDVAALSGVFGADAIAEIWL
jgi:hypothetical protein